MWGFGNTAATDHQEQDCQTDLSYWSSSKLMKKKGKYQVVHLIYNILRPLPYPFHE